MKTLNLGHRQQIILIQAARVSVSVSTEPTRGYHKTRFEHKQKKNRRAQISG